MFINDLQTMQMAHALARHAAARQELIARNVANADTPGWQARDLPDFATIWDQGALALHQTRPEHSPGAVMRTTAAIAQGDEAAPNGNTVSLEGEMVKAAVVRQAHDMALAIHQSVTGTLRATLGRR